MSWHGQKVVVTGGAGFIGSHVTRDLVARGAHVTVFDNLSTGRMTNLLGILDHVDVVRASTLEPLRLARAMRGASAVFHLAAVLGVKRTWEEPVRVIHENLAGTENVLRAASDAGVRTAVLASSSEVYGDGLPPYGEETPAAPKTGYAAAKLTEEKMAEAFTHETGIKTSSLRYFNVYGRGQECSAYGFVTAIFCDRVRAGLPPIIFGDGEQTRDFTYVSDIVSGTLLSAHHGRGHDVFNLGTGRETTIKDLARAVAGAAGRRDLEPTFAPPRADEVRRRLADARKAREVLGWVPTTRLEDGLRLTLDQPMPERALARA